MTTPKTVKNALSFLLTKFRQAIYTNIDSGVEAYRFFGVGFAISGILF
jgi:hypothetical protein